MSCVICGGPHPCPTHVGYKGQRYEVRYTDADGKQKVFGWTNDPADRMLDAINAHPVWRDPVVVDLKPDSGATQ